MNGERSPLFFLLIWFFALGMMAWQIEKHQPRLVEHSKGPLYLFLGSAKEAIGDTFFLKANSYLHGGVSTDLLQHEEMVETGDRGSQNHESFKKKYTDWVYQVNSRVKVMEHIHLQGEQSKEILPLLASAIKLDPYNVPAILTTAYWLDSYFKKTDEAIEILRQGLKDNPDSWEIEYHLGMNYLKSKKDFKTSSVYFESSIAHMNKDNASNVDLRDVYYYLAESYMGQTSKAQALKAYQKALTFFDAKENPNLKSSIARKIKDLADPNAKALP